MEMLASLFDRTKTQVYYVLHLGENLRSLKVEMEKMMELRNDLLRKVEDAEERHMKRTERVAGWLKRVDTMKRKVDIILSQGEQQIQNRSLGRWHKYHWSTYKLGMEVITNLEELYTLKIEGNFNEDELANSLKRPKVDKIPVNVPIGMDALFWKAWSFVQDDDVSIIGIYGPGGVGKSTLLARINNMLADTIPEFDFVIYVVVSSNPNVGTIQDKIAKVVRLQGDSWSQNEQQEKAGKIFSLLSEKRFVLLLDDLWDPHFDLQRVGIPHKQYNSKIIIATRLEDVCGGMGADKRIKVDCLTEQKAWELFQEKVGEEALYSHHQIEDLAKDVVKECGGLPLVLITVARAMASKKSPEEWSFALSVLRKSAAKFPNMENKVFPILKFSYDSLCDEMTKACFLNCSLFPEDHIFYQERMIMYWMGEGFLGSLEEDGDLYMVAAQRGKNIISELKRACLLEEYYEVDGCFKMHDVVRDMALWINYSENGDQNNKYLLQEDLNLTKPPLIPKWEAAKMISLRRNKIETLEGESKCKNLSTLVLSKNVLKEIANDFFKYMPNLKVLDLSENKDLTKLPESLFKLTSLQFLDLHKTGIKELSPKFKELQKLKFLSFFGTLELRTISSQVISSLTNLEQLDFYGTGLSDTSLNQLQDELECSEALQHLKFTVKSDDAVKKLLSSEKLNKIIYALYIQQCRGSRSLQLENNHVLRRLEIDECEDVEEVTGCWTRNDILSSPCFRDLSVVDIIKCKRMKDATWLMILPNIKDLRIGDCDSMEHIIGVDGGGVSTVPTNTNAFASLQLLILFELPALKCICSYALPFPCMYALRVEACPKLKKLPFDSNYHAKTSILARSEWWEGLQWEGEEGEAIRDTLYPLFVPCDGEYCMRQNLYGL